MCPRGNLQKITQTVRKSFCINFVHYLKNFYFVNTGDFLQIHLTVDGTKFGPNKGRFSYNSGNTILLNL